MKPLDKVPFIETLTDAYSVFSNSKSRVKILSQILLYYTYYEGEQKKILDNFKLFMDQPFDNAFKYRHLIVSYVFLITQHNNSKQYFTMYFYYCNLEILFYLF